MHTNIHSIILSLGQALLPTSLWGATGLQENTPTEHQQGIKIEVRGIQDRPINVERFALWPSPSENNQGFAKYKVEPKDGYYVIHLPADTLYHLMLYPNEAVNNESVSQEHTIELFANSNTSLTVEANFRKEYLDYHIDNSTKKAKAQIMLQEFNESCAHFKSTDRNKLSKNIQTALGEKDYNTVNALYDKRTAHKRDFRLHHPGSTYSAYLLTEEDDSTFLAGLAQLSEEVRSGILGDYLSQRKSQIEYQAQIAAQSVALQHDKHQAPRFAMPTTDGKQVALSQYLGKKYVVLDFWGSWCTWCIKGMPRMKAFLEAHQDKMQLIGVNCADKTAPREAAIKKHQMTWPQVVNLQGADLVMAFGVVTYPTKVVISPDGYIDSIYEGESDEFYKHMERVLK